MVRLLWRGMHERAALTRSYSYPNAESCEADPLNPCSTAAPCLLYPAWCGSGMALGFGNYIFGGGGNMWACVTLQVPAGALPQGNEFMCFDSKAHCEAPSPAGSMIANPCSADGIEYIGDRLVTFDNNQQPVKYQCQLNSTFCVGGLAGLAGLAEDAHSWVCPASYQINSMANADGILCFADKECVPSCSGALCSRRFAGPKGPPPSFPGNAGSPPRIDVIPLALKLTYAFRVCFSQIVHNVRQ